MTTRHLSVEEEYPLSDQTSALSDKDWAGGSREPENVTELVIPKDGGSPMQKMRYPPRLPKMFDEILVNAADHAYRMYSEGKYVTLIDIKFDPADGSISVFNDGKGIPVAVHAAASKKFGHEMYVVEFIMGNVFQGSNLNRAADCIIGGTNGVGVKLVNANSTKFHVETDDLESGQRYSQTWTDRMRTCAKPKITSIPARGKRGTRITFWPDYELLNTPHPSKSEETAEMINTLIRTRAITVAVYTAFAAARFTGKPKPPVVAYNGENLSKTFSKPSSIASAMFPGAPQVSTRICAEMEYTATGQLKINCKTFNMEWEMCVVSVPGSVKKDQNAISVINGIVASDGGHIKRVWDIVCDTVCDTLRDKLNADDMKRAKKTITTRTFIVLYCQIPNPGWEGQRKDRLSFRKDKFSHYTIEKSAARAIAGMLAERVLSEVMNGATTADPAEAAEKLPVLPPETYQPALAVGKSSVRGKYCITTEGNSAKSSSGYMGLDTRLYGYLAIGGVITNARRETDVFDKEEEGQYVKTSKKFKDGKLLKYIKGVYGFRLNVKYDAKSIAKLNYDAGIIIFVDQDQDGMGFILGLILSMIEHLWPALIQAGYIKWMETPLIRCIPKKNSAVKVIEQFYDEPSYRKWVDTVGDTSKYNIRYYKGLARHSKDEWVSIAKTMHLHLYTFTYDPDRHKKWFEVYFGNDPNKRKAVLRYPPVELTAAQTSTIKRTMQIPCDLHLRTATHAFQQDNIYRKLLNYIDGQTQSSRKIVDATIRFLKPGDQPRVAQFAGVVTDNENYHHGEAAMQGSLYCRMHIYPGGVQLPFIVPEGNAGSRAAGGKDAGAARYVGLECNKRLNDIIFPSVDYPMLSFNFNEGVRCEPKYFVPIVPLAVLETIGMPATGWAIDMWARDLRHVVQDVLHRIRCDDLINYTPGIVELPPYLYRNAKVPWTGDYDGEMTYGKYTVISRTPETLSIRITELPLGVWTYKYIKNLQKRLEKNPNEIFAVTPYTADPDIVDIVVDINPATIEEMCSEDGMDEDEAIIEYLFLRRRMNANINLTAEDGSVIEYDRYIDVVNDWYPHRKAMYIKRVKRVEIVLSLQIKKLENIVRYIREADQLKLAKLSVKDMIARLTAGGYVQFARAIVKNPGFLPTEEIIPAATTPPKANFDYLIDMSDRDKSAESLAKYEAKLAALREQMAKHMAECKKGAFPGAAIWRRELEELLVVYEEGCATEWTYGERSELVYK